MTTAVASTGCSSARRRPAKARPAQGYEEPVPVWFYIPAAVLF